MKKRLSVRLMALLSAVLLAGALSLSGLAFSVDPNFQLLHGNTTTSYSTLSDAVNAAANGDVITLAGEVSSYIATSGVTITKELTFKTGKDFGDNRKYLQYNGTSAPLFTVENGGVLTIIDSDIYGNENSTLLRGGFVYVKSGGKLILDGKSGAAVTVRNFRLKAKDSMGGVVYVQQGGTVEVNGVTFTNNFAADGCDIFAERKTDVTVKSGVAVDFGYPVDAVEKEPAPGAEICPLCGKAHADNALLTFIHSIFLFFRDIIQTLIAKGA